jgi:hypothetical protein
VSNSEFSHVFWSQRSSALPIPAPVAKENGGEACSDGRVEARPAATSTKSTIPRGSSIASASTLSAEAKMDR